MVSWIRMFTDASGHPGVIGSYGRVVTRDPSVPRRALYRTISDLVLASPGTVDTNAPTRFQYLVSDAFQPLFYGACALRYTADDVAAYPNKNLTASLFIAPASAFAANVVPTPSQIRDNAIRVTRAGSGDTGPAFRTTPGDLTWLQMYALPMEAMEPNKKFWLCVAPTAVDVGSPAGIANDVPVGDINANGRAVSVWTNRTPLAPVITDPVGQITAYSGQTISLKFSPRDPDRIKSFPDDSGVQDFDDMAGIEFQYRARPTTENPNPVWMDLPITDLTGQNPAPGWYIDETAALPAGTGAYYVWISKKLFITCGEAVGNVATSANLPAGDWEIRLRTFDYGHGWSDAANRTTPPGTPGAPPLADYSRSYTASTYPAVNTSPWSASQRIIVSAQVPKPVPVSPINNVAIVGGDVVNLVWQYRNTHVPPYEQTHRVVQVRKTGETEWTTVVEDNSNLTTVAIGASTLTGYALVSGNQYQWRVKATDSSGSVSDYSDVASFWVVPEPASGAVIPEPGEIIDGAALGCGTHTVSIYRRGGKVRVGEITGITSLEWNRVRDDISDAKIVIQKWGVDCGNLLASLKTWAYEVVIHRNNGFSVDRVWEGPITLLTYERDAVTIQAKDVMAYTYRRIIRQKMSDVPDGATVTDRAARIIQNAFAPDDPNVLGYLHVLPLPDDAKQYRSTPAYSRTAYEEVDDMAANAGLDYTAVGRSILLWGTKHRIGTLPEFRDADLGNSPIVSEYGMSMANRYAVSDGNGVWGAADRLPEGEEADPDYGLIEVLSSTWASDSAQESGTYTQEGLATVRASFAASAERSIASRYPAPVVVRVPDNTRLNPDTVLSIQHLVPGVVVPLRSNSTLRTVVASQKLDKVKVVEQNGEEAITITLSPFSRDDAAVEGETE